MAKEEQRFDLQRCEKTIASLQSLLTEPFCHIYLFRLLKTILEGDNLSKYKLQFLNNYLIYYGKINLYKPNWLCQCNWSSYWSAGNALEGYHGPMFSLCG